PSTSTSSQSRLSVKKTAYLTVQTTSSSTQKAPMIFPSIPTAIRSRTSTISTPRRITTSSPLDRMPDSESHSDRLKIQRGVRLSVPSTTSSITNGMNTISSSPVVNGLVNASM